MPAVLTAIGTDAQNVFEDLSGIASPTGPISKNLFGVSDGRGLEEDAANTLSNPYDAMLQLSAQDPAVISTAYATHRTLRNAKFTKILRSPDFPGVNVDTILCEVECAKREGRDPDADEVDPRHCLVFWARPPKRIRELVKRVQALLSEIAPDLWLMPEPCLHMTVLELTHSTTPSHIASLISTLSPSLPKILSHTLTNRAPLTSPLLSFDASALALSFLPSPDPSHKYTYHHLRRDLYNLCADANVDVDSRYILPSAHITVARFVQSGSLDGRMEQWVSRVEEVNTWLVEEGRRMEKEAAERGERSEWMWEVGEERGLDCRSGRLWYGGGETVGIGEGF